MEGPTLILMAAGMGSRFGGLKQITPVDDEGHILMDFSLYDAWRAGFRRAVFVIKEEMERDFRRVVEGRGGTRLETAYAFQRLDDLPAGFAVPEGRVKPWGTAHAVRACRELVRGPFAVVNADDFYGAGAFSAIYDFLTSDHDPLEHAMVAYRLRNTVTAHGHVARGVCTLAGEHLAHIQELLHIVKRGEDAAYTQDGETFLPLAGDTPVSMNLWGFSAGMMDAFTERFADFLRETMPKDPLKAEYFLPMVTDGEMRAGRARVRVLTCEEQWHGVTYREDLPELCAAVADMKKRGLYPARLWE